MVREEQFVILLAILNDVARIVGQLFDNGPFANQGQLRQDSNSSHSDFALRSKYGRKNFE
jgi:hypothetical protein